MDKRKKSRGKETTIKGEMIGVLKHSDHREVTRPGWEYS